MLQYIRNKILAYLENANVLKLNNSSIPATAVLKGVRLRGRIFLGERVRMSHVHAGGNVSIGRYSVVNGPGTVLLSSIHGISIGSFCSIAREVIIQEYNHPLERVSTFYLEKNVFGLTSKDEVISKGPIVIGNDVWIGAKSIILSGVNIGDGAVVAAGSVVTKNVPPYAIMGGNPARVIRYRFPADVISTLLSLQWWDWSIERIESNRVVFSSQLTRELLDNVI